MSDNELGRFLRTRREAVTPAQVGIPDNPRRRTPGLRRAELATLAGVSVDYLVRLEQGRDRHPSSQVLAALADAMGLATEERYLMLRLAKAAGGVAALCPAAAGPPSQLLRPIVRTLLDRVEPTPAYIANSVGDLLAYTTGYQRLAGPVGLLDAESPNLLRFLFTDARARDMYPDWDQLADGLLAHLRMEAAHDDPHTVALVEELSVTAGATFADRYAAPPAVPSHTGVERLAHPEAGELRLAFELLELPHDHQRLVVYLPADEMSSMALDQLTGRRPGALHAVAS